MKHSWKITLILLGMFFLAQLIGLGVLYIYKPVVQQITTPSGELTNITSYNLPYGVEPPQNTTPQINLISIMISLIIAISIMFLLMTFDATIILRYWFLLVITIALGITINAFIFLLPYASYLSLLIALPLAYLKVFKRNMIVHNSTELLIYPGIAAIFVPLLNLWTISILLIVISLYDMYAVWHTGIMQKMAQYQIKTLKVFSGFFIPYRGKQTRPEKRSKKVKMHVAILGGGDVVFPIMVAGVVLRALGWGPAFIVVLGATAALASLFYMAEKGKFYPAMPFISAGCFAALGIIYIL